MRGIRPENAGLTQLHSSKIREVWDRHYRSPDAEITREHLTPALRKITRKSVPVSKAAKAKLLLCRAIFV
jgi:hypothetical protein